MKFPRLFWKRKPFVQVVKNKKALRAKYFCRKSKSKEEKDEH